MFEVKARCPKNIPDFFSKPSPCSVELVVVAYWMMLETVTSNAYNPLIEFRNLVEKNLVRLMKGVNRTTVDTKRFTWVRTDKFYNKNMRVAYTFLSMVARSE